ncbi:MAG TPA: hypothetical protein VMB50_22140 [Myxococcales bacterium]|nr:hypothetical protein [Myxococcales bacterium]
MTTEDLLQQAVNDLAMVRRAIDRAHSERGQTLERSSRLTSNANFMLQLTSLLLALGLLAFDASTHLLTGPLLESARWSREGQLYLLVQTGASLPLLVGSAYLIVWMAARRSDEGWDAYVARHFKYLRNLSLIGDLFVKFVVLALLVEARHPEWIAALLTLYLGDYLVQGRFFVLPLRLGLAMGLGAMGLAILQLWLGSASLVWPLLIAFVISSSSAAYLALRNRRRPATAAGEATP